MGTLEEMISMYRQKWPVAPNTAPWEVYKQYRQSVRELLLDVAQRLNPRYFASEEHEVKDRICNIMRGGTKRSLGMHGVVGSYSFLIDTQTTTLTDIGWPNPRTSREEYAYLRVRKNGPSPSVGGFVTEYRLNSHDDGGAVRDVTGALERQMRNHPDVERVSLQYLHRVQQ